MDRNIFENVWTILRENNFDSTDDLGSDVRCMICKKILIDACDAPCGCCFCKSCITDYLNEDRRKCPGQSEYCGDRQLNINRDIHSNRVINMKISKLSVKCPNIGCHLRVELKMMENHLRICDEQAHACPYLEVGCNEKLLSKEQVTDHIAMETYCHSKLMTNWMSNCQNEMNSLKRDMEKLKTENIENKEKMRMDGDQSQAIKDEILRLKDEIYIIKSSNRSMEEELETVKDKHMKEISILKEQVEIQTKEIDQLNERCQLAEAKCDEIRDKPEKNNDLSLKQTCDLIKLETAKSIENIQEMFEQSAFREFFWCINDWSQRLGKARKNEEKFISSKSLLSHKSGYKFHLSAQPDFDKKSLSIKFCIVKGPFDDSLWWPFDRDMELSLVNLETISLEKTNILPCSHHPDNPALQKPTGDSNPPFDQYLLIPIKELSSKSGLCMKNTILIKLTIKPPSKHFIS